MPNGGQPKFGTGRSIGFFNGAAAFSNMRLEFERAAEKHANELHESFYVFGGQNARFRIVGHKLAEHITRPFSHLRTAHPRRMPTKLTIEFWDENRTGNTGAFDLPEDNGEWYETTFVSDDDRFIGQRLPYTFSCLDRQLQHICASIAWNERISNYERAKPFARLLLEWHNDQGIQIIHAALVARDDQGLLIAGKRGAGKSTVSLACVRAGFDYLSEDFVGLERRREDSFFGHSLYNSVFLETVALARFGDPTSHAIESAFSPEEKSAVILSGLFPDRLQRTVPIRALALPRVVDSVKAKCRPASKGDALLGLGPSSFLQIPNRLGVRGFDNLAELVERVPCYWLEVCTDLRSIGPAIETLLDEVSPGCVDAQSQTRANSSGY